MSEAEHKLNLVKGVKALGGYGRRLEDKFALGLLDLVLKLPGHNVVMAEGKLIEGNAFGPTKRQYEEGKAWIKAGALVLLIGWRNKVMYISPWVEKADRQQCWARGGPDAESLLKYLENENAKTPNQDSLQP